MLVATLLALGSALRGVEPAGQDGRRSGWRRGNEFAAGGLLALPVLAIVGWPARRRIRSSSPRRSCTWRT
ncbi:MAG: hypothetical protein R2699_16220 [Acidimicrobiales bacterium]